MLSPKYQTKARRLRALTGLSAALLLSSACHLMPNPSRLVVFPEAHSRNLTELHRPDGQYKYNGILLGDWGYLAEELQNRDRGEFMSPARIPSPSAETIENLSELLSIDHSLPYARSQQLKWCARLVQSDESDLVRELSAVGLTAIGLHMGLKELKQPPPPEEASNADELSAVYAALLRELRLAAQDGHEGQGFLDVCQDAMQLPLNLEGAWRLHSFSVELQGLEMSPATRASLGLLIRDMEETLVGLGLFAAIEDRVNLVALAGLEGFVKISGSHRILPYLTRTDFALNETQLSGLLLLIRAHGLPDAGVAKNVRRACLSSLLGWAMNHPSAKVRVHAMLALQRVAPEGPKSIREEDWAQWQASTVVHVAETP
jgi:hypothetical protein